VRGIGRLSIPPYDEFGYEVIVDPDSSLLGGRFLLGYIKSARRASQKPN
jgi:hypothetical protein